jgi:parallel beta-helix repeat protein
MQAALVALKDGGHITLPRLAQPVYVGPNPVRPAVNLTNLIIELNGSIEVPTTPVWNATHPSLFHFADLGTYNNLTIRGSGSIYGNATNQTTSSTNNYGKQNCIWVGNATNLVIEGLSIRGFGNFAVLLTGVNVARVSGLIIDQTVGNNDTFPTRWGANADGVHAYESRNVMITDCNIKSTDDCVAFTINASGTVSSNYTVANCILQPYAGSQFVPSGIRLGLETGISNSTVANVLIADNIIRPVGANGMYIGTTASATDRSLSGIKIIGNIVDRAAFDPISIGPNFGTNVTHNSVTTGGITISNAKDVEVTDNLIINNRAKGISIANVGLVTIRGNTVSNIVDSWTGATPRGAGVYLPQGVYGNNDVIVINGNTITGTDGGSIISDGSVYDTLVSQVQGNILNDWLRGVYLSAGRSQPAILLQRSRTNYISENLFSNGKGSSIVISSSFGNAKHVIANNSFQSSLAPTATVGGTEHIRVTYSTAGSIGGQLSILGNQIGAYKGRAVVLENLLNTYMVGNSFLPDELDGSVAVEMVYLNYGTGTTGSATLIVANNTSHIATKAGANPSIFTRTINNNGSGGSTVTLSSSVAQNVITPASGMAHFLDGFASGARDIAYGATTTIPNSSEIPIRNRVTLAGNTTLAWTNPSPGQRGHLDIYPDTVSRVVTLPSLAYSPTGSTFTINGGTGSTNYTRVMWEVHQVGGTNRITVIPTEVMR